MLSSSSVNETEAIEIRNLNYVLVNQSIQGPDSETVLLFTPLMVALS